MRAGYWCGVDGVMVGRYTGMVLGGCRSEVIAVIRMSGARCHTRDPGQEIWGQGRELREVYESVCSQRECEEAFCELSRAPKERRRRRRSYQW